ncbi:hypothetical protein Q5752_003792 [Cryptotrichosporon argae]
MRRALLLARTTSDTQTCYAPYVVYALVATAALLVLGNLLAAYALFRERRRDVHGVVGRGKAADD